MDLHRDIVFSPEVPAADQAVLLAAERKQLVRYGDAAPPDATRWETASGRLVRFSSKLAEAVFCAGLGAGTSALVGVFVLIAVAIIAHSTPLPDDLANRWAPVVLWALSGTGLVCGLAIIGWDFKKDREDSGLARHRLKRVLHRRHDAYVVLSFLPFESQKLVERAYTAVRSVLDAEVTGAGLLDEIANRTVLPEKLWNIAEGLALRAWLVADLERTAKLPETAELKAVLKPRRKAVKEALTSATERVERLEEYAAKVATADASFAARRLADDDRYLDLMARTTDRTALIALDADADGLSARLKEAVASGLAIGSR